MSIQRKINKTVQSIRKYGPRKYDEFNPRRENPTPFRGMPATYSIGSDRYAGTVIDFTSTFKTIWFEFGYEKDQQIQKANPRDASKFTLREDGVYRECGAKRGSSLFLGVAEDYRDPSF